MYESTLVQVSERDSSEKKLLIVQEEWEAYTGTITKNESVSFIASLIYSKSYASKLRCGIENNTLVCSVYAYPIEKDLKFEMFTSYGGITGGSVLVEDKEEYINFNLSSTAKFDFPPKKVYSTQWQGACFDTNGEVVSVTIDKIEGMDITISQKIYGSLKVRYSTLCHEYLLTTERRETAIDSHWTAVVYGVYEGGEDFLEIEMPPGVDEFENDSSAICGGSSGKAVFDKNEFYPPSEGNKDRNTDIDYCSQNVISDVIE